MTAVSDAGPLIRLSHIGHLNLIRELFGGALIPRAVEREIVIARPDAVGVEALKEVLAEGWLRVVDVQPSDAPLGLTAGLDAGEAEALRLAWAESADVILVDDLRARVRAETFGLTVMGTVGILRVARDLGLIERALPLLERLQEMDFWIAEALLERIRSEES